MTDGGKLPVSHKSGPAEERGLSHSEAEPLPPPLPTWLKGLCWLWCASCALSAMVGFATGRNDAAIFYIVCGLLLCPLSSRWLRANGVNLSRKVRAGIAICALLAATLLTVPPIPPKGKQLAKPEAATSDQAIKAVSPVKDDDAEQKAGQLEAAKAKEAANKGKIEEFIALTERMEERDYEGRLAVWQDITALAPANAKYATERDALAEQVASLAHLRENPEMGASVEKVVGRKEAFGNVFVIDITLRNDSLSYLKDFTITCESKGPSGTVTDTNSRVLYEVVEARKSKKFRNLNMGFVNRQATNATCRVDASSVA